MANENGATTTIVEDSNDGKQPQSNEPEISTGDSSDKQPPAKDNKTVARDGGGGEGILIGSGTIKTSENGSPIDKAAAVRTTTTSASSRSSQSAATTTAEEGGGGGAEGKGSSEICASGASDLLANNLPNSINETNRNDSSSTIELLEFGNEEGTYLAGLPDKGAMGNVSR